MAWERPDANRASGLVEIQTSQGPDSTPMLPQIPPSHGGGNRSKRSDFPCGFNAAWMRELMAAARRKRREGRGNLLRNRTRVTNPQLRKACRTNLAALDSLATGTACRITSPLTYERSD